MCRVRGAYRISETRRNEAQQSMNQSGFSFFTEDFGFFTPVECGYPRLSAHWCLTRDGDPAGYALYQRHYSAAKNRRSSHHRHSRHQHSRQRQFVGPGEKLVLLGTDARSLFVWQRSLYRQDGQSGVNCAVFRNEGHTLSSTLIAEASQLAWLRWPEARLFTFVDPCQVRPKRDPGRCFLRSGWRREGTSIGGLLIFAIDAVSVALTPLPSAETAV